MNLRETILAVHSKKQTDKIVHWIGHSQERFDRLFDLFLHGEYRVVQRAAWPLSECVIHYPYLIQKHFRKLLSNLEKPGLHIAVKRNTVRLLQYAEIPKKYQGEVMTLCFSYISSPPEAVAVKAFSLSVLQSLSNIYPEIKDEIRLIISERWEHETAAFRSRAKRFLNEK